ncbi:HtaA domain-containing protein [Spirillospora sp. CA-255316]
MSKVGMENSKNPPPRVRVMTAVGAALLAAGAAMGVSGVAFAGPAVPAPPVAPATVAGVTGGHLDWRPARPGGPAPSLEAGDGATVLKDGWVRFKAENGTYDTRTGAARVSYKGWVVLTYPGGEVTLRDPVAELGGTARPVLSAVVGPAGTGGGLSGQARAPRTPAATATGAAAETEIGELKTFGMPPRSAGRGVTWSEIPATLTADGAGAFPSGHFAGADLGAVTVSLLHAGVPSGKGDQEVRAAATTPTTTPTSGSPTPTGGATDPPSDCATPTPTDTGTGTGTPTTTPTTTSTGSNSGAMGLSAERRALATTTPTTTPTGTPTDTGSPTPTGCTTPPPDGGGGGGGDTAGTGGGDSLPKTGGAIVPLVLAGAGLSATGGGVMVAARRRGLHARP